MSMYKKNISYFQIIFVGTLVLVLISVYFYIDKNDEKWTSILSGVITGGAIFLIQAVLAYFEYSTIEKYRKLGVTDILANKKKREFYGELIALTNRDIKMLGITASDLISDFANKECSDNISNALLTAIKNKRKIQFLLAKADFLDEGRKAKANAVNRRINDLLLNDNFEVRYYNHIPAHSVFIVDNECIVGPVFSNKSNRETSAIHLKRHSLLAKQYEDYFDSEWNNAEE